MARNTERFHYYRVGIPVDSDLLNTLIQDARSTGMATEVAKLITIRLADYYKGNGAKSTPTVVEEPETHPTQEVDEELEQKRRNALASVDAWE